MERIAKKSAGVDAAIVRHNWREVLTSLPAMCRDSYLGVFGIGYSFGRWESACMGGSR